MAHPPVRWGFLSTANIGRKVWHAIRLSGNGVVSGVASRDADRAGAFIRQNQAVVPFEREPRAFGSYEELLASPDIDAVYIPLPTGLRRPWVEAAARAGKHILCEKPCAESLASLDAILSLCAERRVQFMDGVMFMHGARLKRLREILDDGQTVGELRRVTSSFSFPGDARFYAENIRLDSQLEPFGCLGDLGWYCLRLSLWAANWRLPRTVVGHTLRIGSRPASPGPVPVRFSGELFFEGWSAGFHCAFDTSLQQWAHCDGTRGGLSWDDFVVPGAGRKLSFRAGASETITEQESDPSVSGDATCLYRDFAELVLSGKQDPFWPEITRKTQLLLELCFRSAAEGGRALSVPAS